MRKLWIAALLATFSFSAQIKAQAPNQGTAQPDPSEERSRDGADSNTDQDINPEQNAPQSQGQEQAQNTRQGQVQGQIVEVDHLNRQVTIAPRQGQEIKVNVPENTRITMDGVASPNLGLIREGQFVRASLSDDNSAETLDVRVRQYSGD